MEGAREGDRDGKARTRKSWVGRNITNDDAAKHGRNVREATESMQRFQAARGVN